MNIKISGLVLLLGVFGNAYGYSVPLHKSMSELSAENSKLGNLNLIKNLGLPEIGIKSNDEIRFDKDTTVIFFPNSDGEENTILELVTFGAEFEDSGIAPINHFYDPQNEGRGATKFRIEGGHPSPNWILEDRGDILGYPEGGHSQGGPLEDVQLFSYKEAKGYFYNALTDELLSNRRSSFGLTFQSLGQIIHHVQDMAQPQHTRNDDHCDTNLPGVNCFIVLQDPSLFEEYTGEKYSSKESVEALYLSNDLYSDLKVQLPRVRDYWDWSDNTDDRGADKIGMAEYSSANFITEDTNFRGRPFSPGNDSDFPLPRSGELSFISEDLSISGECISDETSLSEVNGIITWAESDIVDGYVNNTVTNPKASTFSTFQHDLLRYFQPDEFTDAEDYQFSVNRCVFDQQVKQLIPRAVAFSAGLIDFFFRGEFDISVPDNGIYDLIDLSREHSRDAQGNITDENGDPFGYKKIALQLKNTTPDIVLPAHFDDALTTVMENEFQQDMFEGELVAVIKYQPNYCYQPDGSGEFSKDANLSLDHIDDAQTANGCTASEYFTNTPAASKEQIQAALRTRAHERIVVSAPIPVGPGHALTEVPKTSSAELDFDFTNQPIPPNARDLILQVVYRGKMGPKDATDQSLVEMDAVAVGSKDILEPTDIVLANSDQIIWYSEDHDWLRVEPAPGSDGRLPEILSITADATYLQPGKYSAWILPEAAVGQDIIVGKQEVTVNVNSPYFLEYDANEDMRSAQAMEGSTIHGRLFAGLSPSSGIDEAEFFLDDEILTFYIATNGSEMGSIPIDSDSWADGEHTIRTILSLSNGEKLAFDTAVRVHNNLANHPPILTPIQDQFIEIVQNENEGSPTIFEFHATDPDGDLVTMEIDLGRSLIGLGNLTFQNVEDGLATLSGKIWQSSSDGNTAINHSYPAFFTVTVTATDGTLTNKQTFRLSVGQNQNPSIHISPERQSIALNPGESETVSASLTDIQGRAGGEYEISLSLFDEQSGSVELQPDWGLRSIESLKTQLNAEWAAAQFNEENLNSGDLLLKLVEQGVLASPINDELIDLPLSAFYLLTFGPSDTIDVLFTSSQNHIATTLNVVKGNIPQAHHIRIGYLGSRSFDYQSFGSANFDGDRFAGNSSPTGCSWTGGAIRQWYPGLNQYPATYRAYDVSDSLYAQGLSANDVRCRLNHQTVGTPGIIVDDQVYNSMRSIFGSFSGEDKVLFETVSSGNLQ